MGFLIRMYDKLMSWTHSLGSLLLFFIRMIWGWQFIWIGWDKLNHVQKTAEFFASLGIKDPETMVYVVGGIEAICGFLLFVGLLTRLAALPLTALMIGAYTTAHVAAITSIFSDFETFTKEAPFLFLYASLVLLCFGPGKFSLDYLIRSKNPTKK